MVSIFNAFIALAIALLIILVDYHKRRPTDILQKRIFSFLILSILATLMSEMLFFATNGVYGSSLRVINIINSTLFFQLLAFNFSFIILAFTYTLHGNVKSFKRMIYIVIGVNILLFLMLFQNIFTQQITSVTHDNMYTRETLYIFVYIAPVVLTSSMFVSMIINRKIINRNMLALALTSMLPIALASALDMFIYGSRMILNGFFVSVLFFYLFIIRMSSITDYLTNIYNRRGLEEHLKDISKSIRRRDYSIIIIDMNDFKKINDKFGHTQGDNALRDVGQILRQTVRRGDFVARYGGDEFVVIAATNSCKTIKDNIKEAVKEFNNKNIRPYKLAMSIGGDVYKENDLRSPSEFLAYVDGLMYSEKINGEKRVAENKNID